MVAHRAGVYSFQFRRGRRCELHVKSSGVGKSVFTTHTGPVFSGSGNRVVHYGRCAAFRLSDSAVIERMQRDSDRVSTECKLDAQPYLAQYRYSAYSAHGTYRGRQLYIRERLR